MTEQQQYFTSLLESKELQSISFINQLTTTNQPIVICIDTDFEIKETDAKIRFVAFREPGTDSAAKGVYITLKYDFMIWSHGQGAVFSNLIFQSHFGHDFIVYKTNSRKTFIKL
ncbi:hypothetical protein [Desertivirga xinjiangensis]|uniref:hypothetical protein n=1 Tax=Desertivirga xinjiangensis TaxID=539206 RepID=UPI00210F056E|nr:hypothetical protein [Pedobacter xinjiangensis]